MKYVSNKYVLYSLFSESIKIPNGFRLIPELIMHDVSLVLLGDNIPVPIINFIYGSKRTVLCQFFWIGQAYPCWVSVFNSRFKRFPIYDWSHLKQTRQTSWNGSKSDTVDLKGKLL